MKTKIFFLLATMLLTSMCAFAQSGNNGTLKGDVNGDGVVDVADINAVIEIMKNGGGTGEETKYYWYAGQTQPQNMSSNPTIDDTNFTVNKWHTLGTATTIAKTITGGTSGNDWYVAVPTSINLKPTATDLSTPDTSWDNLGTITISGISYTVWRTNGTGSRCAVYMAGTGEETKYYWYVGQTPPTALPTNDSQLATGLDAGWRKISNTKPIAGTVIFDGTAQDEINIATTKVTQYFAINSDVTIGSYDSQGVDQTSTFLTGPTVSNGMNIYTTTSKSKTFGHIIKIK